MPTVAELTQIPLPKSRRLDSVSFMNLGKKIVVDNFNMHRNPDRSDALTTESVSVVWFVKALGVWKMIISSNLARGLLWEVTYNSAKEEIYLDVYSKRNSSKINVTERAQA